MACSPPAIRCATWRSSTARGSPFASRRWRCSSTKARSPTSSARASTRSRRRRCRCSRTCSTGTPASSRPSRATCTSSPRAPDRPALGHAAADHDPRQGLRHGAAARFGMYSFHVAEPDAVSPEGQRHARRLHGRRSRRPSAQHDRRARLRRVRQVADPLPRHGRQSGGAQLDARRGAGAHVRSISAWSSTRSSSRACRCRKSCSASSTSASG